MLAEGQATVPKDAIMIELLSGQAAIEAKEYDVLDWEQVQEIKKVSDTVLAGSLSSESLNFLLLFHRNTHFSRTG